MIRTVQFEIPLGPTLFTPLQLNPLDSLKLGLSAWDEWLRRYVVSHQRLHTQHKLGVVVAGAKLEYPSPCKFDDSEHAEIITRVSLRKGGALVEAITSFRHATGELARVTILLRPVAIGDDQSLAATPVNLPAELVEQFHPEEINDDPLLREVPHFIGNITSQGRSLAKHRHSFTVYRHAVDRADQWVFAEVAAYVGASRESLALAHGAQEELLMQALSQPLTRFDVELRRPYFLFDEGLVDTQAYWWENRLVFVHRLLARDGDPDAVHATVVEQMATDSMN